MTTKEKLDGLYSKRYDLQKELENLAEKIEEAVIENFLEENPILKVGNIVEVERFGWEKFYILITNHDAWEYKGEFNVTTCYKMILLSKVSNRQERDYFINLETTKITLICHESEFVSKCKQYHHFQRFTPNLDSRMIKILQSYMEAEEEMV